MIRKKGHDLGIFFDFFQTARAGAELDCDDWGNE